MFDFGDQVSLKIQKRREVTFLILSGVFLGSLSMLNILSLTKLIEFEIFDINVKVPIGVLPYPITFLCTDFISEIYGQKRANNVVWVGLLLNVWVLFILWLGDTLPPHINYYDAKGVLNIPQDTITNLSTLSIPEQFAHLDNLSLKDTLTTLNNGILPDSVLTSNPRGIPAPGYHFYEIKTMTFAATFASMIAYLTAQFVDVQVFHFLKKITKGKHLWLRNNASTVVSQLVDSFAVILIAHYFADAFHAQGTADEYTVIFTIIFSSYLFKFISAIIDTLPFYIGTKLLSKYLDIDPNHEFNSPSNNSNKPT